MALLEGRVISRFGQQADVEAGRQVFRCAVRRKLADIVCGDNVIVDTTSPTPVITKRLPRATVLKRRLRYQGLKAVAANLTQVCLVATAETSTLVIDKYIVAVALSDLPVLLVVNKADLFGDAAADALARQYRPVTKDAIICSAKSGTGMATLRERLKNQISVLVGQSGVGKSTITNALIPDAHADIGEVSETSGLGKHTTSVARLYHLPSGGDLIDSPGIREFSLDYVAPDEVQRGFSDILAYANQCRFRNCLHVKEPGCAVRAAVQEQAISPHRYDNYLKILAETGQTV